MAAPALSIVELAESERTVLLRANIAEGGDADLSNLVLADIADYAAVGPEAVALSINRIWWSLENMNVELKFEADTPVKAVTLSGNGSYDFSAISGVKNPGGSGSTGSILLDTYGIAINAALGCVGSLVIELWKVRSGEAGGALDSEATSSLFTPEVPEVSGGIIIGGNSTAAGYIQFLENSDNGSNYVQVQAAEAMDANYELTLPDAGPGEGQVLISTSGGILGWEDAVLDSDIGVTVQPQSNALTELSIVYTPSSESGAASLKLYEDTDEGTNYVELKAPALAGDYTLTLPIADGATDQILKTDGSGNLSWVDNTAGGAITPATNLQGASLKLYEITENGTNYVEIKAPDSLGGDVTLVLPSSDGDASQFLQTNGSGVLSWANAGGGVESGTWTPTWYSGDGPTISYTTQAGTYVDFGDYFYVSGTIVVNTISGAAGGSAYISNLPFSVASTGNLSAGSILVTSFGTNSPRVVVQSNNLGLRPYYRTSVNGADTYITINDVNNGSTVYFTCYMKKGT